MNLIPNGSFESGLNEWESTPSGVTFVRNDAKRFVMLAAEKHSAAICSEPIEVLPGASYHVEVERAIRGDCDVSVIGRDTILHPDSSGEIVAAESPVRVQVTAKPGHRVGLARVLVMPVGPRARILNVRSTTAFRKPGEPFEVICEIRNTGSEPLKMGLARLLTEKHLLAEEHKQEIRLPEIPLGGSVDAMWVVANQRMALAPFFIEAEFANGVVKAEGATLRHVPHLPPTKVMQSVGGAKRWFTVGSRGLRLTAHETDLDFGPALLTAGPDIELGVLHHLAQIALPNGGAVPLWSTLKRITPGGVSLTGKNDIAEWKLAVRPEHAAKGIVVELNLSPKRRIVGASLEMLPFQTPMRLGIQGGWPQIQTAKEAVRLGFSCTCKVPFLQQVSQASGLVVLRSEILTLSPGMPVRVVARIFRPESSIIRGE